MNKTRSDNVHQILIVLLLLCSIGIIMVYSASSYQCSINAKYKFDAEYFLKRQIVYVMAGVVFCLCFQVIHYGILQKLSKLIYAVSVACIFLLLTPLGVTIKGATRWLQLGVQFQVAELVKIGVIIALASLALRFKNHLNKWQTVIIMWLVGGGTAFLLQSVSNDLSSSLVILGITFCITFVYTNTIKIHITMLGLVIVGVGSYLVYIMNNLPTPEELENASFRVGRIAAWLAPELYVSDESYQSLQALYAIGRGGLFGQGLGNSVQKLSALPESQNDMIFAIFCEEFGILGGLLLLSLYFFLFYMMVRVAMHAKDLFASVLVTGCLAHFALQALMNIAVNLSVIPNTGIGLPFISYGGTAVLCQLAEMAIVLSVERTSRGYRILDMRNLFKGTKKLRRKRTKRHYQRRIVSGGYAK